MSMIVNGIVVVWLEFLIGLLVFRRIWFGFIWSSRVFWYDVLLIVFFLFFDVLLDVIILFILVRLDIRFRFYDVWVVYVRLYDFYCCS